MQHDSDHWANLQRHHRNSTYRGKFSELGQSERILRFSSFTWIHVSSEISWVKSRQIFLKWSEARVNESMLKSRKTTNSDDRKYLTNNCMCGVQRWGSNPKSCYHCTQSESMQLYYVTCQANSYLFRLP